MADSFVPQRWMQDNYARIFQDLPSEKVLDRPGLIRSSIPRSRNPLREGVWSASRSLPSLRRRNRLYYYLRVQVSYPLLPHSYSDGDLGLP